MALLGSTYTGLRICPLRRWSACRGASHFLSCLIPRTYSDAEAKPASSISLNKARTQLLPFSSSSVILSRSPLCSANVLQRLFNLANALLCCGSIFSRLAALHGHPYNCLKFVWQKIQLLCLLRDQLRQVSIRKRVGHHLTLHASILFRCRGFAQHWIECVNHPSVNCRVPSVLFIIKKVSRFRIPYAPAKSGAIRLRAKFATLRYPIFLEGFSASGFVGFFTGNVFHKFPQQFWVVFCISCDSLVHKGGFHQIKRKFCTRRICCDQKTK